MRASLAICVDAEDCFHLPIAKASPGAFLDFAVLRYWPAAVCVCVCR